MKMRLFMMVVWFSMFLTSCQITENIYLQEDGSGKIAFDVDASGMMEIAGSALAESGKATEMDSTFTFRQLFEERKDSIAKLPQAEQQRLKRMENMSVNMKMSAKSKEFKISLLTDFKKADELQDMMQGMKSIKDLERAPAETQNPLSGFMDGASNTDLKYSFDGKTFKRTLKIIDEKKQLQAKDTTGMVAMMFGSSGYTIKYHFPRKVKSVTNPNALYSEDRKTITIQYPLSEYLEQPEKMSFDVVLDRK